MGENSPYEHLGERLYTMYGNWMIIEEIFLVVAMLTFVGGTFFESFIVFMIGAILCIAFVIYYLEYRVTKYIREIVDRKFE